MSRQTRASAEARPDETTDKAVILVVEDEPDVRALAHSVLLRNGFQALSAPNGDAALSLMRVIVPDVLFTDIVLPGQLDGFQLAKAAKTLHPSIKIVMTSGYDFLLSHASSEERRPVLPKPYLAGQLIVEIENALAA
jgi:CheY-like chemotaxis protein